MKHIFCNTGYFFREVRTLFRMNWVSNILTLISTGLIFFLLAMVISGWWISDSVMESVRGEAEMSVYYDERLEDDGVMQLVERIKEIEGVQGAHVISADEAYDRMVDILGKDARVLEYFDDNPFGAFVEVRISLDKVQPIMEVLRRTEGVADIRDNREVLERLHQIAEILSVLGYLIIAAVGISTLVILSHIIRQGIYHNREQIHTLRLLGAPEAFIAFPFLMAGLLLTLLGGGVAAALAAYTLKFIYGQMAGPLPFIPLPPIGAVIQSMATLMLPLSAALGIAGSLFGLMSERRF